MLSPGIEPGSPASQASILSIKLREQGLLPHKTNIKTLKPKINQKFFNKRFRVFYFREVHKEFISYFMRICVSKKHNNVWSNLFRSFKEYSRCKLVFFDPKRFKVCIEVDGFMNFDSGGQKFNMYLFWFTTTVECESK